MVRFATIILVAATTAALTLPAAAKSLKDCRALAGEAERLACYDALEPAAGVDAAALLQQLLGDPEAIGKDYEVFGNSAEVFKMLPGRWVVGHVNTTRSMVGNSQELQKACEKIAVDIAPSAEDPYTLTVMRQDPKLGAMHLRDLLLAARWRLGEATHLGATLDFLRLNPETTGWGPVRPFLTRAVSLSTYLPLTPDLLLTIDGANGEMGLLLRCPAS